MILVDANLLLYAKFSDYPQHKQAHSWLDARLNGQARVGLAWPSLIAFLRIATNSRLFSRPLSPRVAWAQVRAWLGLPSVWIPAPTDRHAEVLGDLVFQVDAASNLVPDAHLAAIAMEHGLTLCSTDGDFARFRGLKWENPIEIPD